MTYLTLMPIIPLSLRERAGVRGLTMFAILIGCLTGCGSQQTAFHDFGLPASTGTQQGKISVNVNAPTWLWDNRIRYRLLYASPSEVRYYGLHRWIASPPELFEQLLVSSGKVLGHAVTIRLQDFEQQFDAPDRARVVLHFSVEAYSADKKQSLGSQMFFLQQASKTPDAEGAINGFIELSQLAVGRIQAWLVGLELRP